jgi:parallel beta-helix repeat protein
MALNHHPMVEVRRIWDYRWHTKRIVIEDLTIDGNLKENPTSISDWSTAAVHLAGAADGVVQRVVVREFITDGISDQYGRFNVIRDCLVEGCRGNGFHPGTSVQGSRFANNTARNNEGDGFFFCADVTGIQVCNNTFVGNKKNGIGGLGGGGDSLNVVSGNICSGNGRHGIHAENGRGNSLIGNVCFDNSTSEPGKYAGVALENTTDTTLTGNICSCKLEKDKPATQGYGIVELGASDRNLITGNSAYHNRSGGILTVGGKTVAVGNADIPPAGQ